MGESDVPAKRLKLPNDSDLNCFEMLPLELVWQIIEVDPTSVLNLKIASKSMQLHVDEYAKRCATLPLVTLLTIFGDKNPITKMPHSEESSIFVALHVPVKQIRLFKLRLIAQSNFELFEYFWFKRLTFELEKQLMIGFDIQRNDDENMELVRKIIGRRVGRIALDECNLKQFNAINKLFNGVRFERLRVKADLLTDQNISFFTGIIRTSNVDQLTLSVQRCDCSDIVKNLLEFASHLHSLRIYQRPLTIPSDPISYLLGQFDFDWAPVILELFSKKLDKLQIANTWYPNYLPKETAELLRKKLPLSGRQIWFAATCDKYRYGLDDYSNDHLVHADSSLYSLSAELHVKHSTRAHEEFETV